MALDNKSNLFIYDFRNKLAFDEMTLYVDLIWTIKEN